VPRTTTRYDLQSGSQAYKAEPDIATSYHC